MDSSQPGGQGRPKLLTTRVCSILITETGERFAYFGFRAILTFYFKMSLGYQEHEAISFFSFTTFLAYFSPLIGALIGDDVGRYNTILYFGILYLAGLAILTTSAAFENVELSLRRGLTFTGLLFACVGTGGIKPCVSAFGADQVTLRKHTNSDGDGLMTLEAEEQEKSSRAEMVRVFFSYFYWCINVGALTSMFFVPIVKERFGFGAAFLMATLFMTTAMILFWSQRHSYTHSNRNGSSLGNTFRLCWWLIRQKIYGRFPQLRWLDPGPLPVLTSSNRHQLVPSNDDDDVVHYDKMGASAGQTQEESTTHLQDQLNDAAQLVHVLPILGMFPIFWCLYDQQASVWTLQAERMSMPSYIQPEQLLVINPFEILIFIPLFDKLIYPFLLSRGWNIAPLRRMAWGMLLAAISFVVGGLVERSLERSEQSNTPPLSVGWQLPQITIMAVGEIFISVTGLEFAYSSSPERLKVLVLAIFLLTTAVGNLFSGVLFSTVFADMDRANVMYSCTILMLLNWLVFRWIASSWQLDGWRSSPQGVELQSLSESNNGSAS